MADNYLENRYDEVFGKGAARKQAPRHSTPSLNTLLVRNRTVRRFRQDFIVTSAQLRTIVEVNAKVASAFNRQALRFRIVVEDNADVYGAVGSGAVGASCVESLREILFREPMRPESARAFIIVYATVPEDRYIDIDLGISLQSMALKATEMGLNCLIKGNIDKEKLRALFPVSGGAHRSDAVPDDPAAMYGVTAAGSEGAPKSSATSEVVHPYLEPLAVLCVGKAAESVFLKPVSAASGLFSAPASKASAESQDSTADPVSSAVSTSAALPGPDLTPYTKDGVHYVPKLQFEELII